MFGRLFVLHLQFYVLYLELPLLLLVLIALLFGLLTLLLNPPKSILKRKPFQPHLLKIRLQQTIPILKTLSLLLQPSQPLPINPTLFLHCRRQLSKRLQLLHKVDNFILGG